MMSGCKHGLKWEHCPFDNIGCETCESNVLASRSAQGYYNESHKVCESSAQRLFCAQEAYKHLLNQLYATENKLRKSRQQLQAAEEQIKAMRSCGNCLNYGDNPDKCEFCIVNGMNNWEWDGYKGVE